MRSFFYTFQSFINYLNLMIKFSHFFISLFFIKIHLIAQHELNSDTYNTIEELLIGTNYDSVSRQISSLQAMPDKYVLAGELCNRKDFEERLPEVMEISLYRIIQEWVNNLIKYVQASQIEIQLKRYNDAINVIIEDNGPGVNKQTLIQSEGNGWKNIQSRISLLNRTIDIESTAGRSGASFICKVAVAISKHTENITL